MSIRHALMCGCVIMGNAVIPALAYADADIIVTTAPPPAKVETIPAPRHGYAWSPGFWKWEDTQHVWVEGHWVEERTNAHWVPEKWWQDPNDVNHWHFMAGHWQEG